MAISDEAKHVEKFGEPLDVSKDKTQGIISAAKTSMKAKQLAPEDTHLDLIREEEELGVPVLPLSRNLDTSEHISKIVHILVQLLQADEFVGRDAVHKALMALLSQDLKASLSALFKHIGSVDEPSQDDVIHEEVLRFIREKVFPIRDEILKPQEMERHITDLIKKSSEDVSGADFRMFMDFLYGLSICGEKAPKEQMLELIGIIEGQADSDAQVNVSDANHIDRLISCLLFIVRGASSSKFLNYLNKHILPVSDKLPDEWNLNLLKALAEIAQFTTPQDSRQILPSVVQLLKKNMPRRKSGEEFNFTYVECLLYTFHHLAHKVPNAANSLCGYKIVTGQPSDRLGEDFTKKYKEFTLRLSDVEELTRATVKKLTAGMAKKNKATTAAAKFEEARDNIKTEKQTNGLQTYYNILAMTKALDSKPPSFIGDKSITVSWKEVPKPAAPLSTPATGEKSPANASNGSGNPSEKGRVAGGSQHQLDLIEEEELGVRVQAVRGLPLFCKDTPEHISKTVDIFVQLPKADDFVEYDAVHKAFMALLRQDVKALFKHSGSVDEPSQGDVIHEKVLSFRDKAFPINAEVLKHLKEMERHVTVLIKKSLEDVTEAEFRMFMEFLKGLSIFGEKGLKESMSEIIGRQADLDAQFNALHSKAPSFIGDKSINLSWKEVRKTAAPSSTPATGSMRKGTTIISMHLDDWIYSVSDGRGSDEKSNVCSGKSKKLWIVQNKYIATLTGDEGYGALKIRQMKQFLRLSWSVEQVMDYIKNEATCWLTSPVWPHLKGGYPVEIGLNGFSEKGEAHVLLAGGKNVPFDIVLGGGKSGKVAFSGSGAKVALQHFRKLVHEGKFQTEDPVKSLKQCLAAAGSVEPYSGGYLTGARIKRGGKLIIEPKTHSVHLVEQIANDYIDLMDYFRNCLLILTDGVRYESNVDEQVLEMRVYKMWKGVEEMKVLGIHLKELKTLWRIQFSSRRAAKKALELSKKDNGMLRPKKKRRTGVTQDLGFNFEVRIPSKEVFEMLRRVFASDSW